MTDIAKRFRGNIDMTGNKILNAANLLSWQGVWSNMLVYKVNDAVAYNGSSYYAIVPNINQEPPNATYWGVFASQGIQGLTGAAGVNGATWYNGSGAPASSTGVNGDFYLNTATSDIYKKVSGSWGSVLLNIKGATGSTGSTGTAGSTWYSGTTIPSSGTGVNGDFYLNVATSDIYKKVSGSWGSVILNIKGAIGATGATGNAATISVGNTTTGAAGTSASVSNSGTSSAAVFNFTIPQGAVGATGGTGATGPGVATGGTAGQALVKIDSTNYNTQWANPTPTSHKTSHATGGSDVLIPSDIGASPIVNPNFNGSVNINAAPNSSGWVLAASGGLGIVVGTGQDSASGSKALWVTKDGGTTYNGFAWQLNATYGASLLVGNGWAERMRVTPTGYVGIGCTPNYPLDVAGIIAPHTDNAYTWGTASYRPSQIYSATSTIATSDGRVKNTITDSILGLDFINKLRPVSYKFNVGSNIVTRVEDGIEIIVIADAVENEDGLIPAVTKERIKYKEVITPVAGKRTHYGMIAQEVADVLGDNDFGGYIYDSETDTFGLRYEEFIAPLIKSVQELSTKVAMLEQRIR